MAIKPVLGKSVRSDWFFLGGDFAVRTVPKHANSKFATKTAEKNVNVVILHSATSRKS